MGYQNKYRTPAAATGITRGFFRAHLETFSTARLFPVKENLTLDYTLSNGQTFLPPAAQYRSFDSESMVNVVRTGEERKGSLPPISIRTHMDEYAQLMLMNAGDTAIGDKMDEYMLANAQAIAARTAIAQAEAVTSGKVTLADRGINAVIDYGRRPELTITAATLWSAVGADPLADLDAAANALNKPINEVWISQAIMSALQRNAKVIELVTHGVGTATIVSPADVLTVFAAWGFNLVVKTDRVVNKEGTEVPLVAANTVVLIAASTVGTTQIGVTTEALDPINGISKGEAAGLFAGVASHHDPSGFNVYASGIILPVAQVADNTASLKVLA